MKKFRINRNKWLRGQQNACPPSLWNSTEQKGCCLGHIVRQYKHCSWKELDGLGMPCSAFKKADTLGLTISGPWMTNSSLSKDASGINDDISINDVEREQKLIELFKANDIELEFYN